MTSPVTRRRFLGLAGAGFVALGVGQLLVERRLDIDTAALGSLTVEPDPLRRVLVVVDLDGGNDPLNTLVPDGGRYFDARPTLAIAESDQLRWPGLGYGINPALGSLEPLWQAGLMSAVWGLGLPGQSRSHFVAQDAWRSARPGQSWETGWLGRWLETEESASVLRAVSIGTSLQATTNLSLPAELQHAVLRSANGQVLMPPFGSRTAVDAFEMLGVGARSSVVERQVRDSIAPALGATNELMLVADPSNQAGSEVLAMFDTAASLIEHDVGTRVVVLTIPGFDTHAGQRSRHAGLLRSVADGVSHFFARLLQTGHAGRPLVVTTSEFGRRVGENRSRGTDHGTGGLGLVFGAGINGGVVGEPGLDELIEGDLPVRIDTRSLYRDSLDWVGGDSFRVLGGEWESIGIVQP